MGTSNILDELDWRGLIAQSTDRDALADQLAAGPVTVYSGFDPTAPSLHAGHLDSTADAASVPAGRPPPDRAGRRRDRNDRRSQGDRRTHAEHRRPPLPSGPTASAVSSNASSTSTTRRPAPSSRTT